MRVPISVTYVLNQTRHPCSEPAPVGPHGGARRAHLHCRAAVNEPALDGQIRRTGKSLSRQSPARAWKERAAVESSAQRTCERTFAPGCETGGGRRSWLPQPSPRAKTSPALRSERRRPRTAHESYRALGRQPHAAFRAAQREQRRVLRPAPRSPLWPYPWSGPHPSRSAPTAVCPSVIPYQYPHGSVSIPAHEPKPGERPRLVTSNPQLLTGATLARTRLSGFDILTTHRNRCS